MIHYLSPSILNSNFLDLRSTIEMLNQSDAEWIHLDIMDGHFVPNLTFGPPIVQMIASVARKPLDVHLMIEDPDRYVDAFIDAGASILTVHYEACTHLHRTLTHIKSRGIKAGVAINPHTPIGVLEEILPYTDLVLNMTVNPGFGGQQFIESSLSKIQKLKLLIDKTGSSALIEVDGGVDADNLKILLQSGVNVAVIGSAIFQSENPAATIRMLKSIMQSFSTKA
ncbi:MAG TPA: ribulose-phosphate 3-epimerase [Bacteroidales bacterium]|nr:ribulose-phosphate 3-epimerase [Bacteroidales bacterium]HPO65236.1 ribulose-phosphate 3-epimerase [Bacteroidales bacterium]